MVHTYKKVFFSALVLSFFISACAIQKSPVTGDKRVYGFNWSKAKKIGAKTNKQIRAQFGVYDKNGIQKYVENVAEKVLAESDLRDKGTPEKYRTTEFHFTVLASPVVNAFALPGGYVYVTRGLMTHLKSEAQLAVVLGHEIGHIAALHASQSAFERQFSKLLLLGGAVAGQAVLGVNAGSILRLGSLARKYLFLSYSREDEREADALGVEYASKEGYYAAAASGFFGTLERMEAKSGGIPNWLSSHPDPKARSQRIPKLAEMWSDRGFRQDYRGIDEYMKKIENMMYGQNPRKGFTEDGYFFHPNLAFYFPYPVQWKVVNTPSVVQMVNEAGNAVILFRIDPKSNTPKESVLTFLQQDGITVTTTKQVSKHGLNGFEATALGKTSGGKSVTFYLYSVAYNGNIYQFITYTLTKKFSGLRNELQGSATNFQPLEKEAILNIQPAKLNVFKVEKSAPFKTFLPEELPMSITPKEVALANQTYLDEVVEKGTWLKIPEQ